MSYYVSDLIADQNLAITSRTPGVGEGRQITWAHVCELADPWNWMGSGGLLMTTGLPVPEDASEQVDYVKRCKAAGIAAMVIAEDMSAPPITPEMIAAATELEIALLSTTAEQPFSPIAKAVATAVFRQTERRLELAEKIYQLLNDHLQGDDLDALLADLGSLLGGTLRAVVPSGRSGSADRHADSWQTIIPLTPSTRLSLEFTPHTSRTLDRELVRYVSTSVSAFLAIVSSKRRSRSNQGSLILSRLIDGNIDQETAAELVKPYDLSSDFRIITWRSNESAQKLESVFDGFFAAGIAHLTTARDGLIIVLIGSEHHSIEQLPHLVRTDRIGASAPFHSITAVRVALQQSRIALDFPSQTQINLYESLHGFSPFLSSDTELLRATTLDILQPIMSYDEERGTTLLLTLKVFLEEDRNWSITADRLHIHRQTLYARISRIESITGKDLSSIAVISDFWLALQAASSLGLLGS